MVVPSKPSVFLQEHPSRYCGDRSMGSKNALWSRRPGLNGRPAVYETAALPTELRRHPRDKVGHRLIAGVMITATLEAVNKLFGELFHYGPMR